MFKKYFVVLGLFLPGVVLSSTTTSTIEKILLYDDAMLVYVIPTSGIDNSPACHTANYDYYSFSMSRPMAKEYLSALMAAQARKSTVTLWGTNTCDDQPVSETLRYLRLEN